jgi:hypothetical protein
MNPARRFGPAAPDAVAHDVSIHLPQGMGELTVSVDPVTGAPIPIACATCHGPTAGGPLAQRPGDGGPKVHGEVKIAHGELRCDACHSADRADLKLADGRSLPFSATLDLCAQCHGVQVRDYRRGSHGGMAGYWDLRRGPRTRNHCVDCHQPHAPAYPTVTPVFAPRDRWVGSHPEGRPR